jgi:short-subunit dehydrogenase
MLERRAGHIINVASMAGLLPFPTVAPYCASKFAVVGLSESLAAELAPQGVRVSLVCPGAVRTGLLDRARRDLAGEAGSGVVALFERSCTSPEAMAARLLPGPMWPLWLLQRSSRNGYNRLWGLITSAVLRLQAGRARPGDGP